MKGKILRRPYFETTEIARRLAQPAGVTIITILTPCHLGLACHDLEPRIENHDLHIDRIWDA